MHDKDETAAGDAGATGAQLALIDPASFEVLWSSGSGSAVPLERLMPTAAAMGLREALQEVARTGVSRRLEAGVVASSRRTVALVVTVHRLPDGALLLVAEHAVRAPRRARR